MTALSPREVAEKCAAICEQSQSKWAKTGRAKFDGPNAARRNCAHLLREFAATLPSDGWVSVKERLPERRTVVQVHGASATTTVTRNG